jgi:hypothetical protein
MKKIISLILMLALLCGCANQTNTELVPLNKTVQCSKPYIINQGSCCLDMNENGGCDYPENPPTTITTSASTTASKPAAATTTTVVDYCNNNVQDEEEKGVDCGGPCKSCSTPCELLINDSVTKPAARTVKLCLSSITKTEYMGSNYSVEESGGIINIIVTDAGGNMTRAPLTKGKDASFGNTLIRFIGSAKQGAALYAQVYAWTIEGSITCSVNSDCGAEESLGAICLNGDRIVTQYLSYRCMNPGTILSRCQASQSSESVIVCSGNTGCINGDIICFPQTCMNGIYDDQEDGLDCGGDCRACHCFDKTMNRGEEGIDCGGECKPCTQKQEPETSAPVLSIKSPRNVLYSTDRLDLEFTASKQVNCSYSLNGAGMTYIGARRNATIYAPSGQNIIRLYCTDSAGNNASAEQKFTVYIPRTKACAEDNVSAEYNAYFEEATFFGEDESILGSTQRCETDTFEYSLSYLNDSDQHAAVNNNTLKLADGNLTSSGTSRIYYDCRDSGKLSISYVRLASPINPKTSKIKLALYFRETKPVSIIGSYWRIYAYNAGAKSVDTENYLDIDYAPKDSECANNSAAKYQEIDLAPLTGGMDSDSLAIRLGFYTNKINSELTLSEIELATA